MNYVPMTREEFASMLPKTYEEMLHTDLHMHSKLSDGHNTLEEMVQSAIDKGFTTIGLSDHATTSFDMSYCIRLEDYAPYREEVLRLREKYADRARILLGFEQDLFADIPAEGFDYIIGSVHFIKVPRTVCSPLEEDMAKNIGVLIDGDYAYIPIDNTPEIQFCGAMYYFHGDYYAFAEEYYRLVSEVPEKTNANIIGHFDLISKFVEIDSHLDPQNPRYIAAWQKAADKLLESGLPFEVNFGAISRKRRTTPYPAMDIFNYLKERGAKFVLSSDSHQVDTIGFMFETVKSLFK